jgi:hypothetical protein
MGSSAQGLFALSERNMGFGLLGCRELGQEGLCTNRLMCFLREHPCSEGGIGLVLS